jgi:hypothetical protein
MKTFDFHIFLPEASHTQLKMWRLEYINTESVLLLYKPRPAVRVQKRFHAVLARKLPKIWGSASGKNFLLYWLHL